MKTVVGSQIRAARGFLRWSLRELQKRSGVGLSAVQAIDAADGEPAPKESGVPFTQEYRARGIAASVQRIVDTLEGEGITFLPDDGENGPGVRFRGR